MRRLPLLVLACATLIATPTLADPGKDESGKGRWRGGGYEYGDRDFKQKYRTSDGCKIERKWKKGEYEEKVKCKPGRYGYRH